MFRTILETLKEDTLTCYHSDYNIAPSELQSAVGNCLSRNTKVVFSSQFRSNLFWNAPEVLPNAIFLVHEPHAERIFQEVNYFERRLLGFWQSTTHNERQQVFMAHIPDRQPVCNFPLEAEKLTIARQFCLSRYDVNRVFHDRLEDYLACMKL